MINENKKISQFLETSVTVKVNPTMTIGELKEIIMMKSGYKGYLSFVGKILQDQQKICDYKIERFSTIHQNCKLLGGNQFTVRTFRDAFSKRKKCQKCKAWFKKEEIIIKRTVVSIFVLREFGINSKID